MSARANDSPRARTGAASWTLHPWSLRPIEAMSAQRTDDGRLEVVAIADGKVLSTTDVGATTSVIAE